MISPIFLHHQKYQPGYIALTSVIICSLLLLTVTAAVSSINYFNRFAILEYEFKLRSSSLAEACVDYALAQLEINPETYLGNEPIVPVDAASCSVGSILPIGNSWPKTIRTQGVYPAQGSQQSYANLKITTDSSFNIISWEEVEQ